MTVFDPIHGLFGGILIGCAVVLLMLGIGRIAGVCGIALNLLTGRDLANMPWRSAFLVGLPLGAFAVSAAGLKDLSLLVMPASIPTTIIAGVLVGIGTTFGSGCTSGHGICGLARLSPRSVAATLTFMVTAVATVFIIRHTI
ncbi:MAG: YeeE/YedE thiosulfate transporter family protein [Alsobacter sp.]